MKTYEDWLKIYKKIWKIYEQNRVRLLLGQFNDNDIWGYIKIIGIFDFKRLKKLVDICEKNNLEFVDYESGELRVGEKK